METNTIQPPPATQEVPEKLTPQQALEILVQAVKIAQSKGIYSFEEAEIISKAIRTFTVPASPAGPQPTA